MSKDIKHIFKSFDTILNENKSMLNEVASSSTSLFGGATMKIPADGGHKGQDGWQSENAWDIKADIGTPVYAIANGTVLTYTDYGPTPVHKNGKTLFGAGFTVDSDNNLPDVYYTHLGDVTVKIGSKIECGQLLGYVLDFPDNDYDHVHIGVESGHNIREFLNDDGTLKCGGGTIPGQTSSGSSSGTTNQVAGKYTIDAGNDPLVKNAATKVFGNIYNPQGVTEQRVTKTKFYLQFCGVSDPMVRNGQQISVGQLIGKTNEDVTVTKFDETYYRENITKKDFDLGKDIKSNLGTLIIPKDSNEKIKSPVAGVVNNTKYFESCKNAITIECYVENKKSVEPEKKKFGSDRTYSDPLMAAIVTAPFKLFKNKYDKDTGELEQKRWGRPGDGRPVDPWIKDAVTAPFKKIGKIFKKNQNEEEDRKVKKVNENIDRIKKLL
jgi:hypothetical protein